MRAVKINAQESFGKQSASCRLLEQPNLQILWKGKPPVFAHTLLAQAGDWCAPSETTSLVWRAVSL